MTDSIVVEFFAYVDADPVRQKAYDELGTRDEVLTFAADHGYKITEDQFVAHFMTDALDLLKLARGISAREVSRPCPCLP